MKPLTIERAEATQRTLNKFRGKPFDWGKGWHCAALLRFQLKALGRQVPPLPPMRSALGARRALDALECRDMAEVLDKHLGLESIAPAQMRIGDVVVAEAEEGLGSVFICVGHGAVMGWTVDRPRLSVWIADLGQFDRAWRT